MNENPFVFFQYQKNPPSKNHIFPTMDTEKKIALIIDCDNAKADAIYGIMEERSKFGNC